MIRIVEIVCMYVLAGVYLISSKLLLAITSVITEDQITGNDQWRDKVLPSTAWKCIGLLFPGINMWVVYEY